MLFFCRLYAVITLNSFPYADMLDFARLEEQVQQDKSVKTAQDVLRIILPQYLSNKNECRAILSLVSATHPYILSARYGGPKLLHDLVENLFKNGDSLCSVSQMKSIRCSLECTPNLAIYLKELEKAVIASATLNLALAATTLAEMKPNSSQIRELCILVSKVQPEYNLYCALLKFGTPGLRVVVRGLAYGPLNDSLVPICFETIRTLATTSVSTLWPSSVLPGETTRQYSALHVCLNRACNGDFNFQISTVLPSSAVSEAKHNAERALYLRKNYGLNGNCDFLEPEELESISLDFHSCNEEKKKVIISQVTDSLQVPRLVCARPIIPQSWVKLLEVVVLHAEESTELMLATGRLLYTVLCIWKPNFDIKNSRIGLWLGKCLECDNRAIRAMSARTLSCFVTSDEQEVVCLTQYLSTLPQKTNCGTALMAWAFTAVVSSGEQLNVLLLRLLESLISTNHVWSKLAAHYMKFVAASRQQSVWQLCSPFWPTISLFVVRRMNENYALQSFCEILQVQPVDFLIRTKQYTLPYLVLGRRFAILRHISEAVGCSNKRLYLDNAPVILAVLLIQNVDDPIGFAEKRWMELDHSFKAVSFIKYLTSNLNELLFEIIKQAPPIGESPLFEKHIVSVIRALPGLENSFSRTHLYRLVSMCSDMMRNLQGRQPYTVKLQTLNGLSLLIRNSGTAYHDLMGQICTILQSALEIPELVGTALTTWKVMVGGLGDNVDIVDLTFAVISLIWSTLNDKNKTIAQDIVMEFSRNPAIIDRLQSKAVPSLPAELQKIMPNIEIESFARLQGIIGRSHQDNIYMIRQTLKDLVDLFANHSYLIQNCMASDHGKEQLALVLRFLLDSADKFRGVPRSEVPGLCSQVMGLLGALDPNSIDILRNAGDFVVASNFENGLESQKFVACLINRFVLKAFEAAVDPNLQKFLAYGIQEFLKFCGLTEKSEIANWYELFPPSNIVRLRPFLFTKYSAPTNVLSTQTYPVFNKSISYETWITVVAHDMMCRVHGDNAETIFKICRQVLRNSEQYLNIFTFLLPYASLNAALACEENRQLLTKEFMTILTTQSTPEDDVSLFHKRVFAVIDYFGQWLCVHDLSRKTAKVSVVEQFINSISPGLMAQRSFECSAFPRAVRYWEQALRDIEKESDRLLIYENMRHMYASMGDVDSLEGVSSKFPTMSLNQQILQHENTLDWEAALTCYDVLMRQLESWSLEPVEGLLNCLKRSGHDKELLARLNLMGSNITPKMADLGVEASWQIGDWKELDRWSRETSSVSSSIGRALLALRRRDVRNFDYCIVQARNGITASLQTEVTALVQIHPILVQLHAITDIERIKLLLEPEVVQETDMQMVIKQLDARLSRVLDYESRRFLVAIRRAAFIAMDVPISRQQIATSFYLDAKDSRKRGLRNASLVSILEARKLNHPLAIREHAKLLWHSGETLQAIKMLRSQVDAQFLKNPRNFEIASKPGFRAKNALLYTQWLDASRHAPSSELIARYSAIVTQCPESEKACYLLAKHYTKIYETQMNESIGTRSTSYLDGSQIRTLVLIYLRCLKLGVKHAAECLPKLLTIWLDFEASKDLKENEQLESLYQHTRKQELATINAALKKSTSRVPAYVFYCGLSQLLSRLQHLRVETFDVVKTIVVTVTRVYPHQALWYVVELINSVETNTARRVRGQDIIDTLSKMNGKRSTVRTLIPKAMKLISQLRSVARYRKKNMPAAIKLSHIDFDVSCVPCQIAIPLKKTMNCVLPDTGANLGHHNAFPHNITFYRIEDEAVVQKSLQQPKRLTVWGSDGLRYYLLCKGFDDVRKDARLLEFVFQIDRILQIDPEASARRLHIEQYHVTPFDGASGVIEWVQTAVPIRTIIKKELSSLGIELKLSQVQSLIDVSDSAETRIAKFRTLEKKYPPVLFKWFISMFPNPIQWLNARGLYTRAAAVMSIIGYILGLGDRHFENLLLLQNTGSLLHVDFDCLFDRGLQLAVPERVPFRLTQNMVDAFGVCGYEGPFRKTCEITLKLLRSNEDMLMTVLEAFLYDPVVGLQSNPSSALEICRDKIRGVKSRDSAPLSVTGQVEDLIQQAVSANNLSRMYIGWMPFI